MIPLAGFALGALVSCSRTLASEPARWDAATARTVRLSTLTANAATATCTRTTTIMVASSSRAMAPLPE